MSTTISISDDILKRALEDLRKQIEETKEAQGEQLLEDVETVQLQLTFHMAFERRNTPIVIKLPHSLFNIANGDSAILFVSDNDEQSKERLRDVPVTGMDKVISLSKARKNLATYKLKRDMSKRYSVYLADESIIPMMPSIIGKKAMDAKKLPYPIRTRVASAEELAENIKSALTSTQLFLFGPCNVIRVARFENTDEEILDNLKVVLNFISEHIPFLAVDSLSLKSTKGKGVVIYKASGDVVAKVATMTPDEKRVYWLTHLNLKKNQKEIDEEEKKEEEKEVKEEEKKEEEKPQPKKQVKQQPKKQTKQTKEKKEKKLRKE